MRLSAALLGLSACFAAALIDAAPAAGTAQYVALGSSYAAGPGIEPVAPASPARCARSAENYAHVLARLRGLALVDATCSAATTHDVLAPGQFDLPAQLDAVTAETQLVTVTIGGNDVFYMANLIALSCAQPAPAQSLPELCKVQPDDRVEERFKTLPDSLREIVTRIHLKSPHAQVVFVTYFTVLPRQGTCARVALTAEQADHMRGIAARLGDVTRAVAKQTGSDVLDVAQISRAHDACGSDPWVLGARREAGITIPPFHPNREAMREVAAAWTRTLAQRLPSSNAVTASGWSSMASCPQASSLVAQPRDLAF
jgi:lysophospholipase L1-like esterase